MSYLDKAIRILLLLALAAALGLTFIHAVAQWHFQKNTAEGIQTALSWDPDNPLYHAVLARVVQLSASSDIDTTAELTRAVQQSPYNARYWADLGEAYELAGDKESGVEAFQQAYVLHPNSPRLNWKLGNFYLRAGRTVEALEMFRKTVLGDPTLANQAFDLGWRATDDGDLIFEHMVPQDTHTLVLYMNYLVRTGRLSAASPVWTAMLERPNNLKLEYTYNYLDALIRDRRFDELEAAWGAVEQIMPNSIRSHYKNSDLVNNGSFEVNILNGGLDWRVSPVEGVSLGLDRTIYFDGKRSLRIQFAGNQNVNFGHVYQPVLVKPNTTYRLLGYMRTRDVTTDSGPRLQIYNPLDLSDVNVETEPVTGTTSWTVLQADFTTGPQTQLLIIRPYRPASRRLDSNISGTAWLDRVSLSAIE